MSYNQESDPRQPRHDGGVEETEAYQPTAEWDAMSEQGPWPAQASDGVWDQHSDDAWHDDAEHGEWEGPADYEHYDDGDDEASAVGGAKQSLSVAAEKITRWFSGLDRRPEYEEPYDDDPVADAAPEPADSDEDFPTRQHGAAGGRRAAAERAIAANRRRSVAASRDDAKDGAGPARGSSHAARVLRGARDRVVVSPERGVEETGEEPLPELMGGDGSARFTVTPLGYNRQAVDEHIAGLERELAELRESRVAAAEPPMSVQEELERIGEQTASILVVAHDKAHETTRVAQQQAERCIADATANAGRITDAAERKVRALEAETDAVRRRRERLIADARNVAASLVSLADEADQRFPADQPSEPPHSVPVPGPTPVAVGPQPAGSGEEQPVVHSTPGS
jgi:hypothetical protein